jgi:hypothetical protein
MAFATVRDQVLRATDMPWASNRFGMNMRPRTRCAKLTQSRWGISPVGMEYCVATVA